MNGSYTNYVLSAHHITQRQKKFKTVGNGEIKSEIYKPNENNAFLKTKHISLLRQTDQLTPNNTLFNPQVSCAKVQDSKDSPDSTKYMRLQTNFKNPSNILSYLTLQRYKSKTNFDTSSQATIIDHVMRKIILTLMTSSNYQLYLWQDISIVVEDNQEIEIQIDKSAMTGMNLLIFGDDIPFREFSKIYEVVSISELKQDAGKVNLCFEMKTRAIAKILLTLLLQRYFDILQEIPDYKAKAQSNQLLAKEECVGMLAKRRDLFKTLLSNKTLINRIQQYQKYNNVHYVQFLRAVFVQESDLSWSQVINKTIVKSKLAELYIIKNQFNLQIIIKKLKYTLIDSKGNNHISFFRKLGLYDDQHALLLALMHLQTSAAQQAISYPNINDFLATSKYNDYMLNDGLFKFLLKAQQGMLDLNLRIDDESMPKQSKHNDRLRKCFVTENFLTNREVQSPDLNQSSPFQVFQVDETSHKEELVDQISGLEELDKMYDPIQINNFLAAVSSNLGLFTLKLRKTHFVSQDYYSQGIRKYQNIFQ